MKVGLRLFLVRVHGSEEDGAKMKMGGSLRGSGRC